MTKRVHVEIEMGRGEALKQIRLSFSDSMMEEQDASTQTKIVQHVSEQASIKHQAIATHIQEQIISEPIPGCQKLKATTTLQGVTWESTKITAPGLMAREIYFVRHGDYYKHKPTQHLSPKGQLQAHSCKRYFQQPAFQPTEVLHSTLQRSIETAQIMFGDSREIMNGYGLLDEIACELEVCGYLLSTTF